MSSFASALLVMSLWILLPTLLHSDVYMLPTEPGAAAVAATARTRAVVAARVGGVRGDLWAQSAFTYATLLWSEAEQDERQRAIANQARTDIERALVYAPHISSVWLLAASLASRFNWSHANPAASLKMSYYTGPNERSLVPLRLFLATHSDALADSDMPGLVRRDVRIILTSWPDLRPAIAAAYRDAVPNAKRLLESAVTEADPAFLRVMRPNASP
jgi:hypothetical protein